MDHCVDPITKVINHIVEGIIQKRYRSGDKLPTELALCELIGCSRGAVRDAMKSLEANNIVKIRQGDGTYLSKSEDISIKNPLVFMIMLQESCFEDIYIFRETLEICIIRLVIMNCTTEELAKIDDLNEQMRVLSLMDGDHIDELVDLDCQFHIALAQATHNKFLCDIYEMLLEVFRAFMTQNFKAGQSGLIAYRSHVDITDAVRARDLILGIFAAKNSVLSFGDWVKKSSASEVISSELFSNN